MSLHPWLLHARPALGAGQPGLALPLAQILAPLSQGTLTVSQLVQISDTVVDGVVVYATPRAAQLFGYAHPSELIGQYVSKIHHPDDALVTRQYALARLHGDWYPAPYPMRILRYPALEPIPVVKHVTQVLLDGILSWISLHTPFDFAQPFSMPITPAMVDRAGSPAERHLLGLAHVAYMDRVLTAHEGEIRQSVPWLLHHSAVHTTHRAAPRDPRPQAVSGDAPPQEDAQHTLYLATLAQILETVARAHRRRQYNVCLKCGWPWFSKVDGGRPTKCPGCGDKHWDRPSRPGRQRTTTNTSTEASR